MEQRPVTFPSIDRSDHRRDRGRKVLACRDDLSDVQLDLSSYDLRNKRASRIEPPEPLFTIAHLLRRFLDGPNRYLRDDESRIYLRANTGARKKEKCPRDGDTDINEVGPSHRFLQKRSHFPSSGSLISNFKLSYY